MSKTLRAFVFLRSYHVPISSPYVNNYRHEIKLTHLYLAYLVTQVPNLHYSFSRKLKSGDTYYLWPGIISHTDLEDWHLTHCLTMHTDRVTVLLLLFHIIKVRLSPLLSVMKLTGGLYTPMLRRILYSWQATNYLLHAARTSGSLHVCR